MQKYIRQIPIVIGSYIAGFTDGEGSFNISFKEREDYKLGVKVTVSFNISQKDIKILSWIKSVLKCGTIRDRGDGVFYYEVTNLAALNEIIIPFFKRFNLRSNKLNSFNVFVKVVTKMIAGEHLHQEGIIEIFNLREKVVVGRKRKHSLADLQNKLNISQNAQL